MRTATDDARLPQSGLATPPSVPSKKRKLGRLFLRLAIVCVVALLLAELALRCFLFTSWFDRSRFAWRLRVPELYAHPQKGDLYWTLNSRWSRNSDENVPGYDPLLGWVGFSLRPPAYDHPDRANLLGRRPVLLYGDSYAQCNTPPEDCFQELLEERPLGATHRIINYGFGAYGFDQVYLLLRSSIDAWEKDRPLVIVSIMIDDDLDRAILSMRDWPKPRLSVKDGALVLPDHPVPTIKAFHEQQEPFVWSYLALRLRHHAISRLWNGYQAPDGHPLADAGPLTTEKQALSLALFRSIEEELSKRHIPHAFVLFHNEGAVTHPELTGWRDTLARTVLDQLGARWYSASDALLERARGSGGSIADYFGREGPLVGHYNREGNQAALDCLERAIADLEGMPAPKPVAMDPARFDQMRTSAEGTAVFTKGKGAPLFDYPAELRRLVLVPGIEGFTQIEYELDGKVESFGGRVRQFPLPGEAPGCGSVRFTVSADDEVLHERMYRAGEDPAAFTVRLDGRRKLTLRVDAGDDGRDCDRLVIGWPVFH